ncbi:MAG: hypothetical protein UT86_C0001G0272 [Candidatus Magasanikbacteria bacterium GW2011_GWC2_40_17]|uniref:Glycosyltransferase RgtA/B/C/D-like domain-containing protein n=1 Tax=Candidatus Magasanikbacteria bacterium GW2011_GWA2_42_32 TaxID=1619039 RepID=A0A0G1A9D4_9BACT|nr:MAG: hypothetical protein UT86_C0001G0272 [Candidatus Magasanikbacteria bacterium GW2011_GWC2_40_17]KKS57632.1 MAG: hypothetical protein UV20_C0001G0272 [Candidatus Magasanikbacteria bacterium GW2011_GWA2_42_32]OGH85908.1 MAG: hypothetical protein A2294_00250 [Candidatus Magasanikbacteria bacterium RIFOXYB2_FULL_38_10]
MKRYLWLLAKKHYDIFILLLLAVIFFIAYLFLYIRPSVLNLSPAKILSCSSNPIFSSEKHETISAVADVEIKCGGGEPVEIKEKSEPAYLILNQPDESVNYFFIRQFVRENSFNLKENLSSISLNQVHPRSTTVIDGQIVPIGFPGFIVLVGLAVKILAFIFDKNLFNLLSIIFTPLLAAASPLVGYFFWRRFWGKGVAFASSVMFFILPAWWYNASRPFQHNLLFVFFLLCAALSFVLSRERVGTKKLRLIFLTGLFWSLCIYLRPAEIIWLLGLGIFTLIKTKKEWSKKEMGFLILGLVIPAILFFVTQYAFYGNIFGSGYVKPLAGGSSGLVFSGPQGINFWQALVLPFGFHPANMAKIFIKYFFLLFRPWFLITVAGWLMFFLDREKNKKEKIEATTGSQSGVLVIALRRKFPVTYLWVWFFISCYILTYYGSWIFYDNLVGMASIGTSYVRYFLPIYVFSLPLAAYFLSILWRISKFAKFIAVFLLIILGLSSLTEVYFKLDGLKQVKETVGQYQAWRDQVYFLTEKNAIIVTRYGDKYIFPGRKVIPGWSDPNQIKAIDNLLNAGLPVYFYDLKLEEGEFRDLRARLNEKGADLGVMIAAWDNLQLIKIIKK